MLPVHAAFPPESVLLDNMPSWVLLVSSARATMYGPYYQAGMSTASGEAYDPGGDGCAVGPMILKRLRTEYAGANGVYGILPCLGCGPLTWNWTLRLTDAEGRAVTCRVNDSGLDGLDIDLPDGAWERVYGDKAKGVRNVQIEVLH